MMESAMASFESHVRFAYLYVTPELEHLSLPDNFAPYFDTPLPATVTISTWDLKKWDINVVQIGEHLYLEKGWVDFRDHYNLGHGDQLFFSYDKESHFFVFVFDHSCLEKKSTWPGTFVLNEESPEIDLNRWNEAEIEMLIEGGNYEAVEKMYYNKLRAKKQKVDGSIETDYAKIDPPSGINIFGSSSFINELGAVVGMSSGVHVSKTAIKIEPVELDGAIGPEEIQLTQSSPAPVLIGFDVVHAALFGGTVEELTVVEDTADSCALKVPGKSLAAPFHLKMPPNFCEKQLPLGGAEVFFMNGFTGNWSVFCKRAESGSAIVSAWDMFVNAHRIKEGDEIKLVSKGRYNWEVQLNRA